MAVKFTLEEIMEMRKLTQELHTSNVFMGPMPTDQQAELYLLTYLKAGIGIDEIRAAARAKCERDFAEYEKFEKACDTPPHSTVREARLDQLDVKIKRGGSGP